MNQIAEAKDQLRKEAGKTRTAQPGREERSDLIRHRLLGLPEIQAATKICCFVSFRSEVNTHELIRQLIEIGKTVCVPRCSGNELNLFKIESLEELEPQTLGILEPPASLREKPDRQCKFGELEVVIVPGLAFTVDGRRLGYGRGHYDRLLVQSPTTTKIAVAFDCQILDDLPTNENDIAMDFIVTESRELGL